MVMVGDMGMTNDVALSPRDDTFTHTHMLVGNLALSRALGDFEFKKNKDLPPEKQAVTGKQANQSINDDDDH